MIELATPETALHIARNIRPRDAQEILDYAEETPEEHILRNAADALPYCWVVRAPDGEPANIWGVYPLENGEGQAWLFSTHRTADAAMTLARSCRRSLVEAKKIWPRIVIYSDPRKKDARKWNELCGFKWLRDVVIDGMPMMEFEA